MSLYKNDDIVSVEYTKDVYRVKWRCTGWCNFHCPYCINGTNKEDTGDWNTSEKLIERGKKINELLKLNGITKPIHLNLIGGEVTYLDLKEMISTIDNVQHINITTNFSRPVEYFKDLHMWCKGRGIKLFLHCSYHKESKDYKARFMELTNWCKENHFSTPRASVVIKDTEDVNAILQEYYDAGITKIVAQRMKVLSDDHMVDLDDQQAVLTSANQKYEASNNVTAKKDYLVTFKDGSTESFKSISNFLSNLDQNGFVPSNYKCYSGLNGIIINWNGEVSRTNCHELDDKPLGNVDTDTIILPKEPYICKNSGIRCCLKNGISVYKMED